MEWHLSDTLSRLNINLLDETIIFLIEPTLFQISKDKKYNILQYINILHVFFLLHVRKKLQSENLDSFSHAKMVT